MRDRPDVISLHFAGCAVLTSMIHGKWARAWPEQSRYVTPSLKLVIVARLRDGKIQNRHLRCIVLLSYTQYSVCVVRSRACVFRLPATSHAPTRALTITNSYAGEPHDQLSAVITA